LFPADLKVSSSMKQVLRRQQFRITYNADFPAVIARCSGIPRPGQDSTWITEEMQQAYIRLHQAGYAMSVESWLDDRLVGGLYGVKIGRCFFGESMFSDVSNASKAAFITFVQAYAKELKLIDCQVETEHLASLGAGFISRETFLDLIQEP
jgi:leucyl/phenylalanyl-tRNA--protein transferase